MGPNQIEGAPVSAPSTRLYCLFAAGREAMPPILEARNRRQTGRRILPTGLNTAATTLQRWNRAVGPHTRDRPRSFA